MKLQNVAADPAVQKSRGKLGELSSQLTAAKADLESAAALAAKKTDAMQAKVAALLDGQDVATTAPPNIAELRERVRLLTAAVDAQRRIVSEAEHKAGVEVAKSMVDEHQTLLGELAAAVSALRSVVDRYFAFTNKLKDSGAKPETVFSLHPFVGRIDRDAPGWLFQSWLARLGELYPKLARAL